MTAYPPAKINIGLFITEKRPDGFHNIETVFYPIPLCDTLEIEASESNSPKLDFSCTGIELPDNPLHENLCCRAYRLLDADYHLPPTTIRLHKAIPVGAGLGGGSSDAAHTLQVLNDLFQLRIDDSDLARYASRLGSDCTFFLGRRPAFGVGKGDVLAPVSLSLVACHIVLVKPPVSVDTAEAYSSVVPRKPVQHLPELLRASMSEWRYTVSNDFETPVFGKFPEIGAIKEELYRLGAVYASMSGSGSSVYGIFGKMPENVNDVFPGCFVWNC